MTSTPRCLRRGGGFAATAANSCEAFTNEVKGRKAVTNTLSMQYDCCTLSGAVKLVSDDVVGQLLAADRIASIELVRRVGP